MKVSDKYKQRVKETNGLLIGTRKELEAGLHKAEEDNLKYK